MSVSKKGARKITVEGIDYLFKVSKVKKKSDWRAEKNELDESFMSYASQYGLGNVMDVTINIVIQLYNLRKSSMFVKYHTILVDGFMGAEQLTQIKPSMVAQLISHGLDNGWNPNIEGDFRLNLVEQRTDKLEPLILVLPNSNHHDKNYQNVEILFEIKIEH